MATSLLFLSSCIIFSSLVNSAAVVPSTVQWSSKSYGPDGPWQAVTIEIGTPPQAVDLLPGGSWMSNVFTSNACATGDVCSSAAAGFYDLEASKTWFQIGQTGDIRNSNFAGTVGTLQSLTGSANWTFDTMSIPVRNGASGDLVKPIIANFDMLTVSQATSKLPDGTKYTPVIGKLSLGAPEANQTWNHFPPNPRWNGTLLPSALFDQGQTPSNSYGMHVGSSTMGIPGSLNIGGYDKSRVLGPVSSQVYSIDNLPIDLLDIGIGVAEGQSPFNFTSKSGILASGNTSIGISVPVQVEATLPYLYLPQSTCDGIAKNLPVNFQSNLGIYTWNTTDPQYQSIVASPSYLSFTFRLNSSITQNFTINVPFALLNLTLNTPIVKTPTQYFPCSPGQGPTSGYKLGRAFMQAAFVGVNWQTGNGRWFLAQAPGPNTPSGNAATAIGVSDNYIVGSTDVWADTWRGAWKAIDAVPKTTPAVVSTNSTTDPTSTPASTSAATTSAIPGNSGLAKGAVAGIAIAVIFLVAASVGALFYLHRRRSTGIGNIPETQVYSSKTVAEVGDGAPRKHQYSGSGYGPTELGSGEVPTRAVEMAGSGSPPGPVEMEG